MTAVQSETFDGVPGGMNLALPAQSIDDTECQYLQDALVDYPGIVRRRGPVRKVGGIATLDLPGSGLVMTLNPLGTAKFGAFIGDGSNGYLATLSDDLTTKTNLTWPHPLPTTGSPYRVVDAKPAILGGLMLGVSSAYDASAPNQGLAFWMGGNKANYTPSSVTVARGSTALTAASGFNANVAPGMWLFADTDESYTGAYIGLVRSVNSDTSITLADVSPYNVTAKAATFQALRGIAPKVVKGRLTCDTNAATVTGGATKFVSQGLNTGTWQIYRASDKTFVGKVTSVQSEFALTLTANATVAMADAPYLAIKVDADFNIVTTASTSKVGFLNATYADRQWYANNGAQFEKTSRIWFSDSSDPEAIDISSFDGDWLDITSSSTTNESIRAICASQNGLLIFKENETFIITGNSPASFAVRKLEDDGAMSGMSVQPFAGGVIWAGREGIHHYDGIQVNNLTASKLGDYWKNTIRTFDPTLYRHWSMVARGHYHLFIENVAPTVAVIKNTTSTTPTKLTVVLNMTSRAFTLATNMNIRGAVSLPASSGKDMWYLVNGRSIGESTDHAYICEGNALFNEEGTDPISCDSQVVLGTFTVTIATPAVFTKTAHGLLAGDEIYFTTTGALPTGLSLATSYFVSATSLTANTFKVSATNGGAVVNTSGSQSGTHTVARAWAIEGPDFYMETKKFYATDSLRLKRFKQFTLEYMVQGDSIRIDTVVGYNTIGQQLASVFPNSGYTWDSLQASVPNWAALAAIFPTWNALVQSVILPRRIRFMKKSQALSIRLYQNSSAVARLRLGPYGIAYKIQRGLRV